jgi:hypothetical protein
MKAPHWAMTHEMIMAKVAGRISRGGRRKALFATEVKAA